MSIQIAERPQRLDPRDVGAYDRITPELSELFWMANGSVSLAVVSSEQPGQQAIDSAVDWARRIANLMPGVSVADARDELVNISDIASRASVAAEALRMRSNG
jgi:hypothetical protein